jgi:hypothetical protein
VIRWANVFVMAAIVVGALFLAALAVGVLLTVTGMVLRLAILLLPLVLVVGLAAGVFILIRNAVGKGRTPPPRATP